MNQVIVLTGGGSGGHITPILAVAAELKRQQPTAQLIYIGQTGDKFADLPAKDPNIDAVYSVRAGKFRRYHGEGLKQVLDVPTTLRNIRDAFYVVAGIWQSWRLMKRLQPSLIFSRGGFVSVPVCIGGALRRVPYITHDSDPVPSLANRLIARWAVLHAVAWPADIYPYPPAKTITTGIPLGEQFVPVSSRLQREYRHELQLPAAAKVLFIIGGGLGSQLVNQAVIQAVPHLLREYPELYVYHGAGQANEADVRASYQQQLSAEEQGRLKVFGYSNDVYRYSGAADVVVTRAGATNLAEFAVQGKACIVVPSSFLSGGHQLQNAQLLDDSQAAIILQEAELADDPNKLAQRVTQLLQHPERRQELADHLATFAQPQAAQQLAAVILEQATAAKP